MPNVISNILFSIAIAGLVIYIIKLRFSLSKIAKESLMNSLNYSIVREELEKALAVKEDKNIENTDGFLAFISNSRDWAFQYIEEVQGGLKKFSDTVGPTIKYLRTYGSTVSTPHDQSIKIISEAYDELEKLLPEDKK